MSRDVWLKVRFNYPSTGVVIRDAGSGEDIITLGAEQDYTWKRGDEDFRLDDMNIVRIDMPYPSWPKRIALKKRK